MALGLLYLAVGVAETVRVVRSGDGGLWFWGGTLLGGGALVLAGLAALPRRPRAARWSICAGSLLGILATAWTIVVPVLALTVVVLTGRSAEEQPRPVV
jgi:hypothetical protein